MRIQQLLVATGLLLVALAAPCQKIYKWTDADGNVQYTQTPPPQGVQSEQKHLAQAEVSEERRRYCQLIRDIAMRLAQSRDQVSIEAASDSARQFETDERLNVDQVALRELVNFVYASAHSHSQRNWGESSEIGGRAHSACLGGSFGKFGRVAGAARTGPVDSGSPGQAGTPQAPGDGRESPAVASSGTGWVTHGVVATNYHVIAGKSRIRVRFADGHDSTAFVSASDADNDVAILSVGGQLPTGLPIAGSEAAIGAEVFTLGYPHTEIMGRNAKLTTGVVNSTTGLRDDPRVYQISVPVQSGNSGGPLLNASGEVVGLVTAKLSAALVYNWTGDLPQNVNYAVKVGYLQKLLRNASREGSDHPPQPLTLEGHAARIAPSVVQVIAE